MANAVVLIGISEYILYEAYQGLPNPPAVEVWACWGVLGVEALGLLVNITGMLLLRRGCTES